MKFLIDAQLPPSLKKVFLNNGYDCVHTLDLEQGNDTTDEMINRVSIAKQRILITKDNDFYDSFIVKKQPYKLVLVKFGNSSKQEIIRFFSSQFAEIVEKLKNEDMVLLRK